MRAVYAVTKFQRERLVKIVRYGEAGAEQPGIVDASGAIRSLRPLIDDIRCDMLTPDFLAALGAVDPLKLPAVDGIPRLGVPVAGIRSSVGAP